MNNPKVSIVISMHNRKPEIIEVMDHLLFPSLLNNGGLDIELILLNDCSSLKNETETLVGKYLPRLNEIFGKVIFSSSPANLGFAGSYNRGIFMARGKYVVVANDDLYFPKNSIRSLVKTLEGPEGYLIAGPITNASSSWSYQYCKQAPLILGYSSEEVAKLDAFAFWLDRNMYGRKVQTDNLCGFCFVADSYTLKAVGGFDERYKYALYEDTDLIQKIIRDHGKEKIVVNLEVFVGHGGVKGSSGTILQQPVKMACALVVNGIKYANNWGYWKLLRRIVFGMRSQITGGGTISELFPRKILTKP